LRCLRLCFRFCHPLCCRLWLCSATTSGSALASSSAFGSVGGAVLASGAAIAPVLQLLCSSTGFGSCSCFACLCGSRCWSGSGQGACLGRLLQGNLCVALRCASALACWLLRWLWRFWFGIWLQDWVGVRPLICVWLSAVQSGALPLLGSASGSASSLGWRSGSHAAFYGGFDSVALAFVLALALAEVHLSAVHVAVALPPALPLVFGSLVVGL